MSLASRAPSARELTGGNLTTDDSGTTTKDASILGRLLNSVHFQSVIASVIIANAATIGFETDDPDGQLWPVLEGLFLLVFVVELAFRMCAYGRDFWRHDGNEFGWNMFDLV